LLSACASRPVTVWTNPALPTHWEAEGKAAVRTRDRGTNVYFTWTQSGPAYQIVVRGPLGLGRAELHGQPGLVRLTGDNIENEVSASSLEELLEMTTRRKAPVSHALHWLKAEPATPEAEVRRGPDGKLLQIKEEGWTIDYLEWSQEAPNLPRRLTLQGPDGQATVVIGMWRLDLTPETAEAEPKQAL
jgi:outer membrane lipoprotein LolB